MCTYEEGRLAIQLRIHERMAIDMKYMDDHKDESKTAMRVSSTYRRKVALTDYPTTLHLYEFSVEVLKLKEIAVHEVDPIKTNI